MPFQCLRVRAEPYLANKLIEKAIFGRVQLARYTGTLIALRYNTSRPSNSSPFSQERPLEDLKDAFYPYKNASKFS